MSVEHWELLQRQKGNLAGAEMARVLRQQFGDVSLPVATSVNTRTAESPLEIKRFTDEQKAALKRENYLIYGLAGQSIKTLRETGRQFWSKWHQDLPDFETFGSRLSEVAINPNQLFLPESNSKTFSQQEEMVDKFSQELGKRVPGVKAVIGQAPDYIELAFTHLDATKDYLFGERYKYDFTRTRTPIGNAEVAVVGYFDAVRSLYIAHWDRNDGLDYILAAPLVVPV